jgi:hypothetical protein
MRVCRSVSFLIEATFWIAAKQKKLVRISTGRLGNGLLVKSLVLPSTFGDVRREILTVAIRRPDLEIVWKQNENHV